MDMIFKFRAGSRIKGDPQAVGTRLVELREKGQLSASSVVEEARPNQSLLHSYFEWNNSKAAEQYRLTQARQLIAAVVVVEAGDEEDLLPVRAFVKLAGEESYEKIDVVLSSPDMRKRALKEVQRSIASLKEKLRGFNEFAELVLGLEEVEGLARKQLGQESQVAGSN